MTPDQLRPMASHLLSSYIEIGAYSAWFMKQHDAPPNRMSKTHHMLAVMQTRIMADSEHFQLGEDYSEFGRVQMLDRAIEREFVLRSEVRMKIERSQARLFPVAQYIISPVVLLAYKFHEDGLDFSVAGARRHAGKRTLHASGPATHVATYPFPSATPPTTTFDQGVPDYFKEIGEVGGSEEAI